MTIEPTKPGAKRGRPAYEPSPKDSLDVANMHGHGLPESQICGFLGISPKTLRKHFRRELATAQVPVNMQVLTHLHGEAISGKRISATIFWAKARCGFRSSGPLAPPCAPKRPTLSPESHSTPSVAENFAFTSESFLDEGASNAR
jgi:hypothetical protein